MITQAAATADAIISYTHGRPDGPAILFLNGAFGTQHLRKISEAISDRYRTVTFHSRGQPKSTRSADYSIAGVAGDVKEVMETTLLVQRIIDGWSHGATLAVLHEARRPSEVGAILLIDGAHSVTQIDGEKARRRAPSVPPTRNSHGCPEECTPLPILDRHHNVDAVVAVPPDGDCVL